MTLKITPQDLQALKAAVTPLDTAERRAVYLAGNFPNAEQCRDLDMRYRWDLLHASRLKLGDGVGIPGDLNLYAYLNDEHIDSALRHLVPVLKALPKCPDCSTEAGHLHHQGCDVERCPDCGFQRLNCGCKESARPRLPWTGAWPGSAECAEFGWWVVWSAETGGWVQCAATTPGATADLNRLCAEATWNPEARRFERRIPN